MRYASNFRRRAVARAAACRVMERLESRTLLSTFFVNGTAGNDTITLSSHSLMGLSFLDYTVNGSTTSVPVSLLSDIVQVDTGGGQDTVNVLTTAAPTYVTGHASTNSDDTLNVGDSSGVQHIGALLHVENPSGYWNIDINNTADTTARVETVGSTTISGSLFGRITGIAPAGIEYKYVDTDHVTIHSGSGLNTVNVTATGSGLASGYTWITGNNDSTVNVGQSGNAQFIQSELVINNPPRFSTLNIDDSSDGTARTVALDDVMLNGDTFTRLAGLSRAPILWNWADVSAPVTVRAGAGGNTVAVNALEGGGPSPVLDLYTGSGADTTTVKAVGAAVTLNVHGQDGHDTVTIPAGFAQTIAGTLSVDNNVSTTTLTVDDSTDASATVVTFDTFTNGTNSNWERVTGLTPGTVQYSGNDVTGPTFRGGGHGNTWNVLHTTSFYGGAPVQTLSLVTGAGADTVNVQSTSAGGTLLIDGQNSHDVVNLGNAHSLQQIAGPVQIQNHPSYTTITADDSADTTARTVTLDTLTVGSDSWQTIAGLAPGMISFDAHDAHTPTVLGGSGGNTFNVLHTAPLLSGGTLTLDTGNGADTVNVQSTASGATLVVDGQEGSDAVNLGVAHSVQQIAGAVNIQNHLAFTAITVDDSADATARAVVLDTFVQAPDIWQSINGLSPGTISYDGNDAKTPTILAGSGGNTFTVQHTAPFFSVGTLTIDCGTGVDTVNIRSTAANNTLLIDGHGGYDSVNLGNAGNTQQIAGAVQIQNHPSFTTVTVDDSADSTARTITLDTYTSGSDTWQSVAGLSPGLISYDGNDVSAPTISAGSGGNTVTVRHTTSFSSAAPSDVLTLNTGTGTDTVAVQSTAANSVLVINGQNDSTGGATGVYDTVTLGNAGNMQQIAGDVQIKNSISYTTITLDDSADTTGRTVTFSGSGSWQNITGLAPGQISYFTVDASGPTVLGGSGGNTFNLTQVVPLTDDPISTILTVDSGSGDDTVVVSGESGSGILFSLKVNGQGGNDSVTLDFSGSLNINHIGVDGGAGSDSLTVKGAPPNTQFTVTAGAITHLTTTVTYAVETLVLDPGTFTVSADLSGMNLTTTGAGTSVTLTTTQHLGTLNVGAGTVVTVSPSGMLANWVFCSGLSIAPTGALDLTNSSLQLGYLFVDPIAAVRGWVSSGYAGGTWAGSGIRSSSANASHGIGFGDTADGPITGVTGPAILVRWTRYGDVNLDGVVGFPDLLTLAQNYGKTGRNWDQGDMNYDGGVAFSDLLTLAQNYNGLAATPGVAPAAPAAALLTVAKRRRR